MSAALHRHTPTLSIVEPRGLLVREVAWHRTEASSLPTARVTQHRFDTAGRSVAHQDPRFFAQGEAGPVNLSSIFSLSGQVLASDNVDAGWRVGLLADDGSPVQNWDSRGSHRQVEYDSLRRPVAIFEQDGCVERFTFGAADADAGCNLRNRCIRHDDPAGTRYFSGYDLNGLVQGERQHFLNALQVPDWPEAPSARDALLEPTEGDTTRRRYLPGGELAEQTDAKGNLLQQHYSVAGRLARSTLQPAGQTQAHELVSAIRYNAFAQVERQVAGNGIVSLNEYDPASGYLQRLQCRRGESGATLQDLHYDYDPAGNVVRHADQSVDTRYHGNRRIEPVNTYEYDTLYQLISATGRERIGAGMGPDLPEPVGHGPVDPTLIGAYTRHYDYDAAGNLLLMQHIGQNNQQHTLRMLVSDVSNKALPWREGLDSAQIENAFDANGNLRELQAGQPLEWDARNQLQRVAIMQRAQGDDDSEVYVYGGGGQWLRKFATQQASAVSHVNETRYLPGIELHSDSATDKRWEVINIEAGRSRIRLLHWHDAPPEGLLNDQLYYGFDNHLGSSTLETDEAGQLCNREEYYPFGGTALLVARNALEVSFKTIRYSGKERDATGLYYYGFRYLAPWLHRWLNPDPAGAIDGLNLYGFVGNNPVTVVDRAGLVGEEEDAAFIRFVGNNFNPNMIIPVPSGFVDPLTAEVRIPADLEFPSPAPSPTPSIPESLLFSEEWEPKGPPSPALSTVSLSTSLFSPQGVDDPDGGPPSVASTLGAGDLSPPQEAWGEPQPGPSRLLMPPPRGRKFECTEPGCRKSFPKNSQFIKHVRSHTGEKPFSCPDCPKGFSQLGNLQRHKLTHTKVKAFRCPTCQQQFALKQNLELHQLRHEAVKPFICSTCQKGLRSRTELNQHIRTHTGERPHKCDVRGCGMNFTWRSQLHVHTLRHHRPGP